MKRFIPVVCLPALLWGSHAAADDVRMHVAAGGTRPVGGDQSNDFGIGAAASGTLEIPATARASFQTSAGALVLGEGSAPKDDRLAPKSTGAAFVGTVGLRFRGYGATRVAGPWVDSNFGVARTGDVTRPAFEAHVGWDFRVAKDSRVDVGPFVGYTQIFQPDSELRGSDGRFFVAGFSIGLGAREMARPAEPIGPERTEPPRPVIEERDALAEAVDVCPDGEPAGEDGCGGEVRIFEDRIHLDDVIHFAFDSAFIREQSHRAVRKIAKFLVEHPDIIDVTIEGHADAVGTDEYNQRLSEARAKSMRDLLVRFGAPAERLHLVAHGKSRPLVFTKKREEKNRRVELYVTLEREEPGRLATANGRNAK